MNLRKYGQFAEAKSVAALSTTCLFFFLGLSFFFLIIVGIISIFNPEPISKISEGLYAVITLSALIEIFLLCAAHTSTKRYQEVKTETGISSREAANKGMYSGLDKERREKEAERLKAIC